MSQTLVILAPLDRLDDTNTGDDTGTTYRAAFASVGCVAIPILPDEQGNPRYGVVPAYDRVVKALAGFDLTVDRSLVQQEEGDEPQERWLTRTLPLLFARFADPAQFGEAILLTLPQMQAVQAHPAYRLISGQYEDESQFIADCAALGIAPTRADFPTRLQDAQAKLRGAMTK